jgi:Zn-dependent alcohol dehydrogenase
LSHQRVRAAILSEPRAALDVEALELEAPGPGEVRVEMLASGVCHSDLHMADGDWRRTGPVVLGHEGAGVIAEVGDGVSVLRPGQFVILSWYSPCLRCGRCQEGRQWLCEGSRAVEHRLPDGRTARRRADGTEVLAYLGLGTFSEQAIVPEQAAVPVPREVPAEVAALIGCCVSTGVGAVVNTARVEPGRSVVVVGLGGVGLSAVMGAALMGADPIVAVDRVGAKLATARRVGATDLVAAGDPDATARAIREATHGGADYVFEAVGTPETIESSVRVLGRGGTCVVVGLTPLRVRASFDAFRLVDLGQRIAGSNYGATTAATDFPRWASLYRAGRLPIEELVEERISLDGVNEALDALRRGEGLRRVIVY